MATRTLTVAGGNWGTAATWVENAVPTSADDVILPALAGNLTINVAAACRSFTALVAYAGTVTHNAAITLSVGDASGGAFVLISTMTYTLGSATTSILSLVSTSDNGGAGWNITTAGKLMPSISIAGAGGKWVQTDAFQHSTSAGTFTLTNGHWDTGNFNLSIGILSSSNTNVRALTLGSSTVTIRAAGLAWTVSTATNMTFSAGTSLVNFINASSTSMSAGSSAIMTYYDVQVAGLFVLNTQSLVCRNFTQIGAANKTSSSTWGANLTCSGTLTITGDSAINRVLVFSSAVGTARTFTAAAESLANVDFMDIAAAGAAIPFTGTSLGDALGNTDITFTASVDRYAVVAGNWSSTATWSATSGGAGGQSVPLPQDNVFLDANSAAGTYTADMPRLGKNIDATGFTRTLAINSLNMAYYGNWTNGAGMTLTASASFVLVCRARTAVALVSAGKAFGGFSLSGPGGTLTQSDALTLSTSGTWSISNGTWTTADFAISCGQVTMTGGTLNLGASTVTLTRLAAVSIWSLSGGAASTLNAGTSTIAISSTDSSAKTFAGGGKVYNIVSYTSTGTGSLTITSGNTFATLNISGAARTVIFPASTTTTILTDFNVFGTAGNLITVESSAAGTPATLSKSSGLVDVDYVSLKDSAATGGALWEAHNSTNVSGNSGWLFGYYAGAAGASTSTGTVSAYFVFGANASGSSSSSGSAAATIPELQASASGASTSAGSAAAELVRGAAASGASSSSGSAAALLALLAAASGASVSTGSADALVFITHSGAASGASTSAGTATALILYPLPQILSVMCQTRWKVVAAEPRWKVTCDL